MAKRGGRSERKSWIKVETEGRRRAGGGGKAGQSQQNLRLRPNAFCHTTGALLGVEVDSNPVGAHSLVNFLCPMQWEPVSDDLLFTSSKVDLFFCARDTLDVLAAFRWADDSGVSAPPAAEATGAAAAMAAGALVEKEVGPYALRRYADMLDAVCARREGEAACPPIFLPTSGMNGHILPLLQAAGRAVMGN